MLRRKHAAQLGLAAESKKKKEVEEDEGQDVDRKPGRAQDEDSDNKAEEESHQIITIVISLLQKQTDNLTLQGKLQQFVDTYFNQQKLVNDAEAETIVQGSLVDKTKLERYIQIQQKGSLSLQHLQRIGGRAVKHINHNLLAPLREGAES